MFLKRISLSGFKSFADRVELDFGPGVTCIVGPNGCGKSNVLDAFKWVLGEQSARSLRGRQMQDMIFNGSSTRKSSGLAQVDLTFDNADRALATDHEEVTISRKLYRSGESEYLINMEPARLKDVREMFLGTGVGTQAYSVIEQGRVDALLQANPQERRIIFEEAAGISKYKLRKREAQRKLERTQQNLLRVEDIIQELEKRLRSVKLQAGKARNYQTYEHRLKELRSTFSLAEYHRLFTDQRTVQHEVDVAHDQASRLRGELGRADSESAVVSVEIDRLSERITALDNEWVRAQAEISNQEDRFHTLKRRIEELRESEARALQRCREHEARVTALRESAAAVEAENQAITIQIDQQHGEIDRLQTLDQELARELTQAQAVLEDEKAGIIDLLRHTARLHNEILSLDRHRESLSDQRQRLELRDAAIGSELAGALEHKALLDHRLAEIDALIAAETQKLEDRKRAAAEVENTRHQLSSELAHAKETRSAMLSRQALLLDLERKMEGIGAGVRKLIEQTPSAPPGSPLAAVRGMVADVAEADIIHAIIIEAAIKEVDQYLVVTDSDQFLSNPDFFVDLPGRVTAVCLDRIPPIVNERDFSMEPGFVARAVDFVRVPDDLEQLARWLLAKTIVVDSLDHARALARTDVQGYRFVTLRGELVESNGSISLGPPSSLAGLISRRSELRDIDLQLDELASQIKTLEGQLDRTSAEAVHLQHVQQELRTAIYESHTARVETNATIQNVGEQIRRLTSERPLVAGEVELLSRQITEAVERASDSRQSLEELQEDNARRENRVQGHKDRIDQLVGRRSQIQEQLTQSRVMEGQLVTQRTALAQKRESLDREVRAAESTYRGAMQDIEQARFRTSESEDGMLSARERLNDLTWDSARTESNALILRRQREMLRMESETLASLSRSSRQQLEDTEAHLHQSQIRLGEIRVRLEELCARVREELGLDLSVGYEHYQHEDQDWRSVEEEIADLRGKIERLGNVNLDAITEQDELEQRLNHLTVQRDDLNIARRQLDELIAKLNIECEERFRNQFNLIRGHFQELFRKLFGGGKADIILENPDDVLESGIEIVARPPGKELQSITLMSGGEKTMTAIALLMSIFRAQPAPFAILDEVDAALDEANNSRFNSIVREFLDRSQFIIISHSKRTMSIADQLYGITMQEPGVSTRVGVRFDQEDAHAAVA